MTILSVNGKRVQVDDSFKALTPEQQAATVDEIANSIGTSATTPAGAADEDVNDGGGIIGTIDALGRGLAKGAGLGFMDEIGAGARWLGGKVLPWQTEVTYDQALDEVRKGDEEVAAAHPVADNAGTVVGAVGTGAGLAKKGLSVAGRVAGRSVPRLMAGSAADGAILGGISGFGQGEGGFVNRAESAGKSALTGLALGAAVPAVVSGVSSAVRRAITPFSSNAERQALVDILKREGVEVTAGQATGSKGLRYAESEIGGQAAEDLIERQGEQFTAAALKRAGVNASRATPDVIDDAFTNIGKKFDDLGARNKLFADRQLQNDLVDTWRDYMSMVNPTQRAPIVGKIMSDLNNVFKNGGALDGKAYQSMRSRLEAAARGTRDPELMQALRGMRESLDDAMERSIATRNPSDLGAWREARNQYRNMLVLERAATGAGEYAAQGIISPSALRNATVAKQGRRAYARGKGDFADLARAGEGVMKALPNSGTAGRLNAQNLGATVTSAIGGIAGTSVGGVPGGVAGAVAGAAIPKVVGKLMMSKGGQAYLRNQLQAGNLPPDTKAAIISAINAIDAQALPNLLRGEGQPLEITVTPALR